MRSHYMCVMGIGQNMDAVQNVLQQPVKVCDTNSNISFQLFSPCCNLDSFILNLRQTEDIIVNLLLEFIQFRTNKHHSEPKKK